MLQEQLRSVQKLPVAATLEMAVTRIFSSEDEQECSQDEDALLKSKWSLAMFSELCSEQHDIAKLGKWLQVSFLSGITA